MAYIFTICLFLLSKQHGLTAVDFKNIFVVSSVTVPSIPSIPRIPSIPNQWTQTNGYNPLCAGFNNRLGLSNAPYNYYMRYNPLCDNQIPRQRTFSTVYPYQFREYSILFTSTYTVSALNTQAVTALFTKLSARRSPGWNDPQGPFQLPAPFTVYGSFRNCTRKNHGTAGNHGPATL